MNLDNTERKFYQETIANLLNYNGLLITALTTRGQMPPSMPMPSVQSFSIPMMDDETVKKMESAWKDSPFASNLFGGGGPGMDMNKLFQDTMKKMTSGFAISKDDDEKLT